MHSLEVSIHAPARGATRAQSRKINRFTCFNPRTREGCDWIFQRVYTFANYVSIHAPARGATVDTQRIDVLQEFQSTHPRGVRHINGNNNKDFQRFQSTHPRGVRLEDLDSLNHTLVSIHAPARGATIWHLLSGQWYSLFQSTHPRGVRRNQCSPREKKVESFNPRTREGCDTY